MPVLEYPVDRRQRIANETSGFLDYVQVPKAGADANYPGMQDALSMDANLIQDLFNADITPDEFQTGNSPLTGVVGSILPMTFRLRNSKHDIDPNNVMGGTIGFTLLVNPNSVNFGNTNAVQASYTRVGYITQQWGPNQMMISSTGSSAGFMVQGIGLTNFEQRRSFAFRNIMALISTYRSNGYTFLDQTTDNSVTRVIDKVTGVELSYDGNTFLGHFNTFTMDDGAEHPYRVEYNFEFIVSMFGTDYREIRGHFQPLDNSTNQQFQKAPVLLAQVSQNSFAIGY